MKILVLLGAGASHGSKDVKPKVPPLGPQLFAELVKLGKEASRLPDDVKRMFNLDFEKGMKYYFSKTRGDVVTFQRELALYLASFEPGKENLYKVLLNKLINTNVVYCSLNYDLLLEEAADSLGLMVCYKSQCSHRGVNLLKIHGSSNFWPKLPMNMFRNCKIFGSTGQDVIAEVETLNRVETLKRCRQDTSMAPALSLYTEGKRVLICKDFVDVQLQMWYRETVNAEIIFIIGVKVQTQDVHVWAQLATSKARIVYFGLKTDEESFNKWKHDHPAINAEFHEAYFEGAISAIENILASQ